MTYTTRIYIFKKHLEKIDEGLKNQTKLKIDYTQSKTLSFYVFEILFFMFLEKVDFLYICRIVHFQYVHFHKQKLKNLKSN